MAPKNILLSVSTVHHKFNFCLLSQKNSPVRGEAGAQDDGEGCTGGRLRDQADQLRVSSVSALPALPDTIKILTLKAI